MQETLPCCCKQLTLPLHCRNLSTAGAHRRECQLGLGGLGGPFCKIGWEGTTVLSMQDTKIDPDIGDLSKWANLPDSPLHAA